MKDSYNFDALLGRINEEAKKAYELAADHSINFADLIPAMGGAMEAYIKTVREVERRYPGADEQRAIKLSFAGISMYVKAHEVFGEKMNDMYGAIITCMNTLCLRLNISLKIRRARNDFQTLDSDAQRSCSRPPVHTQRRCQGNGEDQTDGAVMPRPSRHGSAG